MTTRTLWSEIEAGFSTVTPAEVSWYGHDGRLPEWARCGIAGSPVLPGLERIDAQASSLVFLNEHRRAMYFPSPTGISDGVLAVKGAEINTRRSLSMLERMADERPCPHEPWPRSANERLIMVEHKMPMALTLGEAEREIRLARRLGENLRRRFPPPYRIPVPLALLRWPEPDVQRHLNRLKPCVSMRSFETAVAISRNGLAALVYHYDGPPFRLHDIVVDRPSDVVVERWVRLFAQIVACECVPAGLDSRTLGSCCGPQNATLDGGFVDLDSICPFDELASPDDLIPGLEYSLRSLTRTVALYCGKTDPKEIWGSDASTIYSYLRAAVRRHVERDCPADAVPPAIAAYFRAVDDIRGLMAGLGMQVAVEGAEECEL